MAAMSAVAGVSLILLMLYEAFETILLPRRVTRPFRLARWFYVHSWHPWAAAARLIRPGRRRGAFLSIYGPLSLLVLFGIWAVGLIAGFALLHWSLGAPLNGAGGTARASTFTPTSAASRSSLWVMATSPRPARSGGSWRSPRRASGSGTSRWSSATCRSCIRRSPAAR